MASTPQPRTSIIHAATPRIPSLPATPAPARHSGNRRQRGRGRQTWKAFEVADETAFAAQFDALDGRHRNCDSISIRTMSPEGSSSSARLNDTQDFQVFTSRKNKKVTVNAQSGIDTPQHLPSDLAAMRKSIHEVFGNELPSQDFIRGNPGTTDGQVQFVQHANGDVVAHQWSMKAYEWSQIGTHQHTTSAIHGSLANDDLALPLLWQKQDIGTLAYFRLLAKQREARATGEDFTDKQIKALLPGFRPATSPLRHVLTSPAIKLTTEQTPVIEEDEDALIMPSSAHRADLQHTPAPQYLPGNTPSSRPEYSLATQEHGTSLYTPTSTSAYSSNLNASLPRFRFAMTPSLQQYSAFQDLTAWQMAFSPYALSNSMRRNQQYFPYPRYDAVQAHYDVSSTPQNQYATPSPHVQYTSSTTQAQNTSTYTNAYDVYQGSGSPSYHAVSQHSAQQEQTTPTHPARLTAVTPQTRSLMRTAVMRMSEQAKERTKSEVEESSTSYASTSSPLTAQTVYHSARTSSSPQYSPFALQDSSPDRTWQSRPPITLRSVNSSVVPPLTPQNFDGPFFPADADPSRASSSARVRVDAKKHDQSINDWWWSGNNFSRQEEFYDRLQATHQQTKVASTESPLANGSAPHEATVGFNLGRLLVPVQENLMAYTDNPSGQKRDYFCRWAKAPEWTIDRSATGNQSFFDTDWNPPARVGRDSRFYSTAQDMRLNTIRFRQAVPDPYAVGHR